MLTFRIKFRMTVKLIFEMSSNMSKYLYICIIVFPLFCFAQQPQQTDKPPIKITVPAIVYEGDTIPYIVLPAIVCSDKRVFRDKKKLQNGLDFCITLKRFIHMPF